VAYTGKDLYNDLLVRTYNGVAGAYLNTDRANYVINSAIINLIEATYPSISRQQNIDEISPCVKTEKKFIPNNHKVLLKPLIITNVTIGATPTITFNREHNLIAGTEIQISEVEGATQVNGTFTNYTTPTSTAIVISGITTSGAYTLGTGKAISNEYIIDDYYHLLAVQYQYKQILPITVKSVLKTPYKTLITLSAENNIRSGELLNFSNFNGLSLIGDKYVKKVAYNQIELYNDSLLTDAYSASGTYLFGGTIKRYGNRYADHLNSDQKIDVYPSTAYYPLYQSNDNRLSIVPYTRFNQEDTSVEELFYNVDYVRQYTPIDTTNNVYDIHQDFNAKFCDRILEYATLKFNAMTSDGEGIEITEVIGGVK
jgi:hypothetical protein